MTQSLIELAGRELSALVCTRHVGGDDFICAICMRVIAMRWSRRGPDENIAPICISCERWHAEGHGKPSSGSFRDRREVRRGIALANALHDAAAHKKWRHDHASA